jgi:hypothetical protein
MKGKFLLLLSAGMILFLAGCQKEPPTMDKLPELTEMEKEMGIMLTERGVKYLVSPEKIISGGPSKDGIPSIDNPQFVSVAAADDWIEDNELVLAIIYKGVKRVYPLQIMVWHEIVNDRIAGDPLLVTY